MMEFIEAFQGNLSQKVHALAGFREKIELLRYKDQNDFFANFIPMSLNLLRSTAVNVDKNSNEFRSRFDTVILLRTSPSYPESIRPYVNDLALILLEVMRCDCDEIAAEAMHIFSDLNKVFRVEMEPYVQSFFDLIVELFGSFRKIASKRLSSPEVNSCSLANESFRLLQEAPVIIVLLFQLNRKFINEYVSRFVPLIFEILLTEYPKPECKLPEIKEFSQLSFPTSCSPRGSFGEYISAQIKILSFLAYIARGFLPSLREYRKDIPEIVMRLLDSCPPEAASSRKELLVAIRHILSTELRNSFLPYIEAMMNERLLLGEGYTAHYIFRPAAYSMLADLIHHVRFELPESLVEKVIVMYTRALLDPTLPNGIQTMSMKLLLNLIDVITSDKIIQQNSICYLRMILIPLLIKFDWLAKVVSDLLERKSKTGESEFDEHKYDPYFNDPFNARPIPTDLVALDPSRDNIRDLKFQLKTMINGIKNLFITFKSFTSDNNEGSQFLKTIFQSDDGNIIESPLSKLFQDGLKCFDVFLLKSVDNFTPQSDEIGNLSQDEKELMDHFCSIFTLLDTSSLQDVIGGNIEFLINRIKRNSMLVAIPQYFLAISSVSKIFSLIMIKSLMDRFEELGSSDILSSATVLRLFKLLFLAVSVYPEENEATLQPYLAEIILNCFKSYPKSQNPANYFLLLRSLFRSIGGGRFDVLYKEVLPLLQIILEELSQLSPQQSDAGFKDLYVELCLTTPVRLSNLLPYLSYLMKPILLALKSGTDLVNQGLRTFELCVDNLTPDFLEPIISPVFTDIISCLWNMVKPPPYSQLHSHTAIRLLGKIGGKSRKEIPFDYKNTNENIKFCLDTSIVAAPGCKGIAPIDLGSIIGFSLNLLKNKNGSLEQKYKCLHFLKRTIDVVFDQYKIQDLYDSARCYFLASPYDPPTLLAKIRTFPLKQITGSLLYAVDATDLGESVLEILCKIFRTLFTIDNFSVAANYALSENFIFDGFLEELVIYSCYSDEHFNSVWPIFMAIYEEMNLLSSDKDYQHTAKMMFPLLDKLISSCFLEKSSQRVTACRLLSRVCDLDLGLKVIWSHSIRLIRGVFYVMKSLPSGGTIKYGEELTGIIFKILRLSNREEREFLESEEHNKLRQHYFDQVMLALVTELSNPNSQVRDSVKASFQLLSDIKGCEITDLLSSLKNRVCGPIFSKPLRALPSHVQVGYIDAITYCIELRPPLLEINDDLLRLVNEAVALLEVDESTQGSRGLSYVNFINLRLVCIKLLSTCLSSPEFQQNHLIPLRNQVVSVFFKALYSKNSEIVEISRGALEQVMAQHQKLPTDILQNGLRPVLQGLGDPKTLSLSSVEGLRRVLQLFSHFFKAEIGKKLLDHLNSWVEQKSISDSASGTSLFSQNRAYHYVDSGEVKILTAILELFCLLPNCGQMFAKDIMRVTIRLEKVLCRFTSSPFKPVLARFLDLYPSEIVEYVFESQDIENFTLLSLLLPYCTSKKLVEEVVKRLPIFYTLIDSKIEWVDVATIRIIDWSIAKNIERNSDLVSIHLGLLEKFFLKLEHGNRLSPDYLISTNLFYECVKKFIELHPQNTYPLFLLIRIISSSLIQLEDSSVPELCRRWISGRPPKLISEVLHFWLDNYKREDVSYREKEKCSRILIQPLIQDVLRLDVSVLDDIFSDEVLNKFDSSIWSRDCRSCTNGSCVLAIEEIQLTVHILRLLHLRWPNRLRQYLPKIQNFLFNRTQSLDCSVRYSSLVTLGLCLIETNTAPSEVLHVLKSLMHNPSADIRAVITHGFKITIPFLLGQPDDIVAKMVETLNCFLLKDCPQLVVVVSLWSALWNFREISSKISKNIISAAVFSFSRCSLAAISAAENKIVAVEFLGAIIFWCETHLKSHSENLIENLALAELLLNSILRILISIGDPMDHFFDLFLKKFGRLLELLPFRDLSLKFSLLERALSSNDVGEDNGLLSSFWVILESFVNYRPVEFSTFDFDQYERFLSMALQRCYGGNPLTFDKVFSNLVSKLHTVDKSKELLVNFLQENLLNGTQLSVSYAVLNIIDPEKLPSSLIQVFVKTLQRCCSDFVEKMNCSISDKSNVLSNLEVHIIRPALYAGIKMFNTPQFPRAQFLSSFQLLWEKNLSPELHTELIQILKSWTLDDDNGLSLREKIDLLLTPSRFDYTSNSSVFSEFADIIYNLYTKNEFRRTELPSRYEGFFLQASLRELKSGLPNRFCSLLSRSLPSDLFSRLKHIFQHQRWELLGTSNWLPIALYLFTEALEVSSYGSENISSMILSDDSTCHKFWTSNFGCIWPLFTDSQREVLSKAMTYLFSNDRLLCISRIEFNPIQSIFTGLVECQASVHIPPYLKYYVATTYNVWFEGCYMLENPVLNTREVTSNQDDELKYLQKLYEKLGENDSYFAACRIGNCLVESNVALSFDQVDLWTYAQKLYEANMGRTRAGVIPFSSTDLELWESQWVKAAKQLQQWDLLSELAKVENNMELALDSMWRLADWSSSDTHASALQLINSTDQSTSHLKYLEAFIVLNRGDNGDKNSFFQTLIEESIQLSLVEWETLPRFPTKMHFKLLHEFQMLVEMQECVSLYSNVALFSQGSSSKPQFLADLKGLLTAWRERLPNFWDDMNYWSDVLAWRQHVFTAINMAFAPLLNDHQSNNNTLLPFAYRGYHEIAWLINKFSHIARKNGLEEVCLSFLNRIYSLPNIEIQDAFMKLVEQAKCHLDMPSNIIHALEVVNATNLNYFSSFQKGEFFALRASILNKMGLYEEANRVFAQAVQIDLNVGRGWSGWGQFNDQRFFQTQDLNYAINAVNCYLQAATLFKAHKSRKFLGRILWLLTFEDNVGSIGKSFEMYNHDLPTWFWVLFIPQLLVSISRKEKRLAKFVLIKVAKNFPQALYLPLRTYNEDCKLHYGQSRPKEKDGELDDGQIGEDVNIPSRGPLETAEELLSILKTAYPLLALTLENSMEHIVHRLRSNAEEDLYRLLSSLISELYQMIMNKTTCQDVSQSTTSHVTSLMEASFKRLGNMASCINQIPREIREFFSRPYESGLMNHESILSDLIKLKKILSTAVKKCPSRISLDSLSRFLAEFEYHKYDEVEVFGQYLDIRDNNQDFIRIERFSCWVEVERRHGSSLRRMKIQGTDGKRYAFSVQNPSGRQSRREERLLQLIRLLDHSIKKNISCKRRNLGFKPPKIISISSHARLIAEDDLQIFLDNIYGSFCSSKGLSEEDVWMLVFEKLKSMMNCVDSRNARSSIELLNARTELFSHVCNEIVPRNVLQNYCSNLSQDMSQRWNFRLQFIRSYSVALFLEYIFSIGQRYLHRIGFSSATGSAIRSDIIPMITASGQISLIEIVPFRLTPNIQEFFTKVGIEGPLVSSLVVVSRDLAHGESDLTEYLPLFVRDELVLWYMSMCASNGKEAESSNNNPPSKSNLIFDIFENPFEKLECNGIDEKLFLSRVQQNCELVLKRAQTMSCFKEQEQSSDSSLPLFQSVIDLLSSASNAQKLAQMDVNWNPWF